MAVKEKSFSLTRLFQKSTTKLGGGHKSSLNGTVIQNCESLKIEDKTTTEDRVSEPHRTDEQNNNEAESVSQHHKEICKTKSDTDLASGNVSQRHQCTHNHESASGRLSLKRFKFSHKKHSSSNCTLKSSTSSSSCNSGSIKSNDHSPKRRPKSASDIQIAEDEVKDQKTLHPYQVLFEAIQYKDTTLLDNVFDSYPNLDINTFNEDGIAAIHFAAMVGSTQCISLMVENGADINLRDIRGNPPIHYAISMKKYEFAGRLLELGANTSHLSRDLYPHEQKKKSRRTWHFF